MVESIAVSVDVTVSQLQGTSFMAQSVGASDTGVNSWFYALSRPDAILVTPVCLFDYPIKNISYENSLLNLYFHKQWRLESHDLPVPESLKFIIQYCLLSVHFYSSLEISNLTVV